MPFRLAGEVKVHRPSNRGGRLIPPRASIMSAQLSLAVCVGPSCAARGSLAALAEIEELVAEAASTCQAPVTISVRRAGCSHQCDGAPIVHIAAGPHASARIVDAVDDAAQCERVLDIAFGMADPAHAAQTASATRSGVDGLLHRRSVNARWEALRAMGRAPTGRGRDAALQQLRAALQAELRACGSDGAQAARSDRRARRLYARFAPGGGLSG